MNSETVLAKLLAEQRQELLAREKNFLEYVRNRSDNTVAGDDNNKLTASQTQGTGFLPALKTRPTSRSELSETKPISTMSQKQKQSSHKQQPQPLNAVAEIRPTLAPLSRRSPLCDAVTLAQAAANKKILAKELYTAEERDCVLHLYNTVVKSHDKAKYPETNDVEKNRKPFSTSIDTLITRAPAQEGDADKENSSSNNKVPKLNLRDPMGESRSAQIFRESSEELLSIIGHIAACSINNAAKLTEVVCVDTKNLFAADVVYIWHVHNNIARIQTNSEVCGESPRKRRPSMHNIRINHNDIDLKSECKTKAVALAASTRESVGWCVNDEFNKVTYADCGNAAACLCVPLIVDGEVFGVMQVLYGTPDKYDVSLARIAEAFSTFVAIAIRNVRDYERTKSLQQKAEVMLNLAEQLSRANLDENVLVADIMDTAKRLMDADRCSVFLCDANNTTLTACFENGQRVTIPKNRGIAGHVATTGEVLNIQDAYTSTLFNPDVDKATGYRTHSILCMPVCYEGQIVAVTQLINKKIEKGIITSFTTEDVDLFNTFSTFIGVCLRNCRVHNQLVISKAENEAILDVVSLLSNADIRDTDNVTAAIMRGAKTLLKADRATLFLLDKERNELVSKVTDAGEIRIPVGVGIAGQVAETAQPLNIPDAYADSRFNPAIDKEMGYVTKSILCMPIIHKQEVVAVTQLLNKSTGEFTAVDEKLMQAYSMFAGISLMNARLLEFTIKAGNEAMNLFQQTSAGKPTRGRGTAAKIEMPKYEVHNVPKEQLEEFCRIEYDIHAYRSMVQQYDEVIPRLEYLFEKLNVFDTFGLQREVLTKFLITVRSRYRKVPYHNFIHASDVTQTVFTFLTHGGVGKLLTPLECFGLLVASLVHDVDHMGLNNSFHFKAETPMGILSSASGNTSVLEVHHCNVAIEILSEDEFNVFHGLNEGQMTHVYKVLVECILATDMGKHGHLLGRFRETFANGLPKDRELTEEERMLLMKMVLKSADISNVVKPFEVARKWAIAVTEEFYQQGDREKQKGVEVLPMFDRTKNTVLAKGQIGFIDGVAKAHFELMTKVVETLRPWFKNLEDNRVTWVSLQ